MKKQNKEEEIPLTEDLMREHGLLNRVLLIYEEIIRRIEQTDTLPVKAFANAVIIIQDFVENYHERMEEDYLFPLFEAKRQKLALIRTLKTQHIKGREITAKLKELSSFEKELDKKNKKLIVSLLKKFIRMYRPHEAREDTILFPLVRSLVSEKEFKELGEKLDTLEHELFGQNGFEKILQKVEAIEKELGIYQLDQFTPSVAVQENS